MYSYASDLRNMYIYNYIHIILVMQYMSVYIRMHLLVNALLHKFGAYRVCISTYAYVRMCILCTSDSHNAFLAV